jgi:hypothetical protein
VWLHLAADSIIFLAYVAIPVILVYFIRRRPDVPFRHLFWLFGLFIVGCGFTHFMNIVTGFWSVYRLDAMVKIVTGLASVGTAFALLKVAPAALAMRSPEDLKREVNLRTEELQQLNAALNTEVGERRRAEAALHEEVAARKEAEAVLERRGSEIEALNVNLQRAMSETHHRPRQEQPADHPRSHRARAW